MILRYLDASTGHLTQKTLNSLNSEDYPYSYQYDEGVFISVPENDDPEAFEKLPKDLRKLLKYAWKNDVQLIRLDRDAEVVDELPVYEWNE